MKEQLEYIGEKRECDHLLIKRRPGFWEVFVVLFVHKKQKVIQGTHIHLEYAVEDACAQVRELLER